jgi:hypothetical protein
MDILLLVVIVGVLLGLAIRAWKGYEIELRKDPGNLSRSESFDPLPLELGGVSSPDAHHAHTTHQVDSSCTDSHHGGCDVGGHSFDVGHGGFDGDGHH